MIKLNIFVCIVIIGVNSFVLAQDYCSLNCKNKQHIGCNNSGEFAAICPTDAEISPMTKKLQKEILDRTNQKRNEIASGKLPGFNPASRMPMVEWDEELAQLAELNVKQCEMVHDQCHNTNKFGDSGQNLFSGWYTQPYTPEIVEKQLISFIDGWYKEYEACNQGVIDKYHGASGPVYGHFTALVHYKTNRMGCATSLYSSTDASGLKKYNILFACNLGYTNMIGEPIYKSGEPCSECKKGCSAKYTALCKTTEHIKAIPDIYM